MHDQKLYKKIVKKTLLIFRIVQKIIKKRKHLIFGGKKTRNNCNRKRGGLRNFHARISIFNCNNHCLTHNCKDNSENFETNR